MAMSIARPDPSLPASVADAAFGTSRRGFDQNEVREFLRMVAAELGRLQERERFLERELRWLERYARGVPGAEPLLAELVLVLRRVGEEWDERTRKAVYAASAQRSRNEADLREAPQASIAERFGGRPGDGRPRP